jgi:hypothetical protein
MEQCKKGGFKRVTTMLSRATKERETLLEGALTGSVDATLCILLPDAATFVGMPPVAFARPVCVRDGGHWPSTGATRSERREPTIWHPSHNQDDAATPLIIKLGNKNDLLAATGLLIGQGLPAPGFSDHGWIGLNTSEGYSVLNIADV